MIPSAGHVSSSTSRARTVSGTSRSYLALSASARIRRNCDPGRPIYTAPTASNDALGHGKHEVGAAALTIWAKGIFLVGALVNYQIGVGGDSSKPRTQFIVAQPIVMLQLGKGYCLRSAPIWFFDIEQPKYNVPFGLGAGKVIPTEKIVFNLFIEPQFAMALRGIGQPAV